MQRTLLIPWHPFRRYYAVHIPSGSQLSAGVGPSECCTVVKRAGIQRWWLKRCGGLSDRMPGPPSRPRRYDAASKASLCTGGCGGPSECGCVMCPSRLHAPEPPSRLWRYVTAGCLYYTVTGCGECGGPSEGVGVIVQGAGAAFLPLNANFGWPYSDRGGASVM